MDWRDIGVIVAMVGVIVTFLMNLRGQRQDERLAGAAASRAEAAARLSADHSERVVIALEAIASKDFRSTASIVVPPRLGVRWTLVHHAGDTYRLENVGDETAHDVMMTAHSSLGITRNMPHGATLAPGEATTFLAAPTMETSDSTIAVTWLDDPSGVDRREWRYPLPSRPPRLRR